MSFSTPQPRAQILEPKWLRKCVTLHARASDNNIEETKYAIENVIALMCSDRLACRFSARRNWEVDFVRFLLGFTTAAEEQSFNSLTMDHNNMCSDSRSVTKKIGKVMTATLRHGTKHKNIADSKGAIPMVNLFDDLYPAANPLVQRADGRIFAAMINGNDKQRFFVDIYLYNDWFPQQYNMPWDIYIGCYQGHSNLTVVPSEISHQLSEVEIYSMGWIFHVTDKRFEDAIYANGLIRRGRDALRFMYENDGSPGYIAKGAGARKPRTYETTIYCALNISMLIRRGYDLFLTANGVVLIFDDTSLEFFHIVEEYPYLGLSVFSRSVPHSLPREVQNGQWRGTMSVQKKYEEYLSSDEISKYLDPTDGQLVPWRIPRTCKNKRRQSAWEFMGQTPPTTYIDCISSLFGEEKAEASSGSAPAKEFDVEAELSTMNNQEIQAVNIISESPWHLWQAGVVTLRTIDGQKVENLHEEVVTVLREFWRMSESQQKTLMSQGVTRHVWERCPLAGHSVFFMTRAWEIGRMTAYVKNYATTEDKVAFQKELRLNKAYGWLRDIPAPRAPQEETPEDRDRSLVEKEEYMKDEGEVRMFQLFAEGIEDLYTGLIDKFVRKTPALWE